MLEFWIEQYKNAKNKKDKDLALSAIYEYEMNKKNNMAIKIESKVVVEIDVAFHDGSFKTHPCEAGSWWGGDICEYIDFDDVMREVKLP